ncbi:MAG: hypothetical protein JOZ81_33130 [Chloroflexi bacterium]|nr:hypothetical protein [Chloroflexota bacterium]MBV9543358.1 hypothetical protein [Chloroflexota bacterium]
MIVHGRIIAVQEQRFRLMSDGGQSYVLTLAGGAPLDTDRLADFKQSGARVSVRMEGEPNLTGGIARNIEPA